MIDPSTLGKKLTVLKGVGTATIDSYSLRCPFELVQYSDGRPMLFLALDTPATLDLIFASVGHGVEFEGLSSEGLEVSVPSDRALVLDIEPGDGSSQGKGQLIALCGWVEAKRRDSRPAAYSHFELVNFRLEGIPIHANTSWVKWLDVSPWSRGIPIDAPHGERLLLLVSAEQEAAVHVLRYTRGVDVTCSLVMASVGDRSWDQREMIVRRVCRLLALLRGTRVNWIRCEERDGKGLLVRVRLQNAVVSGFVPTSYDLLANMALTEFDRYMWSGLRGWDAAEEKWDIVDLIDAFVDARSTGLFTESRGLRMCLCLELMSRSHLKRQQNGEYLLPELTFIAKEKELREGLRSLLRGVFGDELDDKLDAMTSHWLAFNRVSFGKGLGGIRSDLGLSRREFNIHRLKKVRNGLVHSGQYDQELGTPSSQYEFLERSVRGALLAILGYRETHKQYGARGCSRDV